MKIICRKYLYKVIEPSNSSRLVTKWNEGDPIEEFSAHSSITVPLAMPDNEIVNTYHEITKIKANKLYAIKNPIEEPMQEMP